MYGIHGVKLLSTTDSIHLDEVLTRPAVEFIAKLHRNFNEKRCELLALRAERQQKLDKGELPTFLEETKSIRDKPWTVASTPPDLLDRRVEITGPTDAKMMINALNSGAKVFMADLEDSSSPSWQNMLNGQLNLKGAVRGTLSYTKDRSKRYELKSKNDLATLLVRPRGLHLNEKNLLIDGEEISASLFDFGLYIFHNAKERIKNQTAPYFYLPKLESHLEARLWNDVFVFAQNEIDIPQGSIRATCLIETVLAAFEMEEILYELRDHASGLNAGRWDYIFSIIKKFKKHSSALLPDRNLVTMSAPFMKAYTDLLIKTCHKRSAYAIGGMAAFIPSRKDNKINEIAISKVKDDKKVEAESGCDGTWVAHPDLVTVADTVFTKIFGDRTHQKDNLREDVQISPQDLYNFHLDHFELPKTGSELIFALASSILANG